MSEFNISIPGGQSRRLKTAGKYCDRDIVVTATGGSAEEPVIEPLTAKENGVYTPPAGVDGYAPVSVNVPIPDGYIDPSGTMNINENGTHNVRVYEEVSVNVPIPDGYIVPSGTLEITDNGEHDVAEYASVVVNVQGGGSDLPAGYTRCDFIQFDGTQLVDTGIIGNQNTKIRAEFTWGGSVQNHLFGCASSDNTASITSYMNGSWRFGNKSASKTIQKNNADLPYSVLMDKTTISVTGNRTSISDVPDFETIGTLLLGGARNSSGELPGSGIVGSVFDFRIWDGDTLALDMIPVTDGSVYRFWDSVSKNFFDSITDVPLEGGNL